MHTTYGREMPVHCSMYLEPNAARRLSCFKLEQPRDAAQVERVALRFGKPAERSEGDAAAPPPLQRLLCTCAPVHDYTGRQVARVGVFAHAAGEQPFASEQSAAALELAWLISVRLGHLPGAAVALRA
jgi:hypothetical protein